MTLISIVALLTLAFALVTEENWRARRAWEKYRSIQEANGEKFDLESYTPKPGPLDQNFAGAPALAELRGEKSGTEFEIHKVSLDGGAEPSTPQPSLGNWRKQEPSDLLAWHKFFSANTNFVISPEARTPAEAVLSALSKYDPVLSELKAAAQRTQASLPFRKETITNLGESPNPFSILKGLTRVFALHASANLGAGRGEHALSDIRVCFRLAECLEDQPTLIVHLVRIAMLDIALQAVWEGLNSHAWNEAQLESLQQFLATPKVLEKYNHIMRSERAFGDALFDTFRNGTMPEWKESGIELGIFERFTGRAMLYQNQIAMHKVMAGAVFPAVNDSGQRVFVEKTSTNVIASILGRKHPYNMLAWMTVPAVLKGVERFTRAQSSIDLARAACALEKYRIAHGNYPDSLNGIVPRFSPTLPLDVITGTPMKYAPEQTSITLFSVGWNQRDDGGKTGFDQNGRIDASKGDWCWTLVRKGEPIRHPR